MNQRVMLPEYVLFVICTLMIKPLSCYPFSLEMSSIGVAININVSISYDISKIRYTYSVVIIIIT